MPRRRAVDAMFQRLHAIALNSFLETVRQPIYSTILITTALLLILNVALAGFTLQDDDKLLLDLGLSTLLLSGLFLAAFSASGVLSQEIENKTVLVVISKPVSRTMFIVGKSAGLLVALTLAFYLLFLVFLLAQRHGVLEYSSDPWDLPVLVFGFGSVLAAILVGGYCNYFYGLGFQTTALAIVTPLLTLCLLAVAKLDKKWQVTPFAETFVGGQVIIAAYLVFLNVLVMGAIALAVSTRFGQVVTLFSCVCALAVGIASDYAFGQYSRDSRVASFFYQVIPNFALFWVVDGLTAGSEKTAVPWAYVGYATVYAGLVVVAAISIGVAAFERREVG
jgi:ABC-type transport system involved in multi-copper enzyme maturation permease subunit